MIAKVHLTPSEERALSRAASQLVRVLVRDWGWAWATVVVGAGALAGWVCWAAPAWWGWVRDWWEDGR